MSAHSERRLEDAAVHIRVEYVLALSGFPVVLLTLFLRRRRSRRLGTGSHRTWGLLRRPGESLWAALDEVSSKVANEILLVVLWPLVILFVHMAAWSPKGGMTPERLVFAAVISLGGVVVAAYRLVSRLEERDRLRLDLDGKGAVGEELNQLMLQGCLVFHDFPAEKFTTDHIVVGPGGVFAIDTKTRVKPKRGRGRESARVVYDGRLLRFPDRQEREPVEQARRQAAWLARWLTDAVTEPVQVTPALALPGWCVECREPDGLLVFNPQDASLLARPSSGRGPLPEGLIQGIAHHVEQRCRDVEPRGHQRTGP